MELNRNLTPIAGAALALITGLSAGAALRPDLVDLQISGPQILMGSSGPRRAATAGSGEAMFAAYGGKLPSYVLGTDFLRALDSHPAPAAEPDEWSEPAAMLVDEAPAEFVRTDYGDHEPAPHRYPSLDGGEPEDVAPSPADASEDHAYAGDGSGYDSSWPG